MVRRAVLAAVAAWLAVVLVGATAVWAVISRAGEDLVTGESQPGLAQTSAAPPTALASQPPLEHRPRSSASPKPSTRGDGSPSSPATSSPTPTPTSPPSSGPTGSKPPQPTQASRTGTWNGRPGTVSVTCRPDGTRGSYSVYARSGWVAETEQEHGGLEVHFHHSSSGEVELKAFCGGAGPRFEVEEDDD